jgi:hypothetical protein
VGVVVAGAVVVAAVAVAGSLAGLDEATYDSPGDGNVAGRVFFCDAGRARRARR